MNCYMQTSTLFELDQDMDKLLPQIRNTTRAVIVHERKILLLRKKYENGEIRYAFPGGGQETGETLVESLGRECQEEIGAKVEIRSLLHVSDCFKPRDTTPATTRHLVEFFFECILPYNYTPHTGSNPDKHQVAVEWKEIAQLQQTNILIPSLLSGVDGEKENHASIYLGKFG